jgi:hypothetical protein
VGVVRCRGFLIILDKVESVQVDQSILGRMLDYGTVTILAPAKASRRYGRSRARLSCETASPPPDWAEFTQSVGENGCTESIMLAHGFAVESLIRGPLQNRLIGPASDIHQLSLRYLFVLSSLGDKLLAIRLNMVAW